ncbi:hypothetical protein FISHEDRAFT_62625 [Fistulina hepatica ATCC 64428]|nr:hypothetical protein FISHEDRAFT_62625 [Fistulina hepatica ATCC 64428]
MSDWFRSVPSALDNVAFAAKFQQETLASQIQYYKSRYQQQRTFIERLKHENEEYERWQSHFSSGNGPKMRQYIENGMNTEQEYSINANGKRMRVDGQHASSPMSLQNHPGPSRLSLPPGQQPPNLNRPEHQLSKTAAEKSMSDDSALAHRPRTRRGGLSEQYAYRPPTAQGPVNARMSYAQAAPHIIQMKTTARGKTHADRSMAPPPTPQVTHLTAYPIPRAAHVATAHGTGSGFDAPSSTRLKMRSTKAPPPTSAPRTQQLTMSSSRSTPASQRVYANRPSVPATPARFVPAASAPNVKSSGPSVQSRSAQRVPFVPGGGFG